MTGPLLFARARVIPLAMLGVLLVDVAIVLVGDRRLIAAHGSDAGIPYATFLPLFAACIVGATARSAFWQFEEATARSMSLARSGCLLATTGMAALGVLLATRGLPGPIGQGAAVRNVLGLTGLALLSGTAFGGRLAWVCPTALVTTVVSFPARMTTAAAWGWPVSPDRDVTSWLIALGIFVLGMVLVARRGTREPPDEKEC
jgi:hypothetical protein